MNFREENLGTPASFLLPSLKLKEPPRQGPSIEGRLHEFLVENFGGYTAQAGNIFGYWRDSSGADSYGEHREFTVGLLDDSKLPTLKGFLATLADQLQEECIYLQAGNETVLIYPDKG
ncbi:MAG TPA: hypothetical protein VEQ63_15340 [Bryobacteraceae bacterium]|nr:hypothetical protein [Bryobacteraceae bacterium]